MRLRKGFVKDILEKHIFKIVKLFPLGLALGVLKLSIRNLPATFLALAFSISPKIDT